MPGSGTVGCVGLAWALLVSPVSVSYVAEDPGQGSVEAST
jgi:hypothetical protein